MAELNKKTGTAELRRHEEDTKNFVKFGDPFERGGQGDDIAGVLYVPKKFCKDVVHIEIKLVKRQV